MASGAARADDGEWRPALAAEFFWIEETCACAAQCQLNTARLWRSANLVLGAVAVLPGGMAGGMMLAGSPQMIVAGALALMAAMTAVLIGVLAPARRAEQAAESTKAYEIVQALARQARLVDLPRQGFEQARSALADLSDRWQTVQRTATPVARFVRIRPDQPPTTPDDPQTAPMSDVAEIFIPTQRSPEHLS